MRVTSRIKKLVRPTLGVLYAARIAFAENVAWGNNLRSYSFKFTVCTGNDADPARVALPCATGSPCLLPSRGLLLGETEVAREAASSPSSGLSRAHAR